MNMEPTGERRHPANRARRHATKRVGVMLALILGLILLPAGTALASNTATTNVQPHQGARHATITMTGHQMTEAEARRYGIVLSANRIQPNAVPGHTSGPCGTADLYAWNGSYDFYANFNWWVGPPVAGSTVITTDGSGADQAWWLMTV